MCGIFGSINFALDDSEVKQSLLSINHRGPDSNGIFRDNNHNHSLIFGHNRLEILDLKMGSQPMVSEDKQYVVIFNGEIYNFDELRRDLKNKGHKFITNNSERMRINNSGNVGIGTSAPESSLHIAGNKAATPTTKGIHLGGSTDYGIEICAAGNSNNSHLDFTYPNKNIQGIIYLNFLITS